MNFRRKPPRRWLQFAWWFRLGVAIAILLSVILSLGGCSSHQSPWREASEVLTRQQIIKVAQPFFESDAVVKTDFQAQTQVWQLNTPTEQQPILIRFDPESSCGALGCLVAAYFWDEEGQIGDLILVKYLDLLTPADFPLLALTSESSFEGTDTPCWQLTQAHRQRQNLVNQYKFCWRGDRYALVDRSQQKNEPQE